MPSVKKYVTYTGGECKATERRGNNSRIPKVSAKRGKTYLSQIGGKSKTWKNILCIPVVNVNPNIAETGYLTPRSLVHETRLWLRDIIHTSGECKATEKPGEIYIASTGTNYLARENI